MSYQLIQCASQLFIIWPNYHNVINVEDRCGALWDVQIIHIPFIKRVPLSLEQNYEFILLPIPCECKLSQFLFSHHAPKAMFICLNQDDTADITAAIRATSWLSLW